MTGLGKFCVGAAATSLIAWGAHAISGPSYIDSLESEAQFAFAGLDTPDGASVEIARDPLSRTVVVTGVTGSAEQRRVDAALSEVPGIRSVRFLGEPEGDASDGIAPAIDLDANEATAEAVADCQDGVNAAMAGKVINFRSGSAYMPDRSLAVVAEVAEVLTRCPGLAVRVEGHSDARGSEEVNTIMSQERADRVAAALVERGVDASRITAEGLGESELLMEGTSAEANAANRRIVFEVSAGSVLQSEEQGE